MIEEAIIQRLTAGSPLASAARVSWDKTKEQQTQPYTVLFSIGGLPLLINDAPSITRRRQFQVSVFASTGTVARNELDLIYGLLHYFSGDLAGRTVQSIVALNEPSGGYETDAEIYHMHQDYEIYYV